MTIQILFTVVSFFTALSQQGFPSPKTSDTDVNDRMNLAAKRGFEQLEEQQSTTILTHTMTVLIYPDFSPITDSLFYPLKDRIELTSEKGFNRLKKIHDQGEFLGEYGHFIKSSSEYRWVDDSAENPTRMVMCKNILPTYHLSRDAILASYDNTATTTKDCNDLRKRIISMYAFEATQGKMALANPYSTHLAYQCDAERCFSLGDLYSISKLDSVQRKVLADSSAIRICPEVVSKKTRLSGHKTQTLSVIVFGQVPEFFEKISQCIHILNY